MTLYRLPTRSTERHFYVSSRTVVALLTLSSIRVRNRIPRGAAAAFGIASPGGRRLRDYTKRLYFGADRRELSERRDVLPCVGLFRVHVSRCRWWVSTDAGPSLVSVCMRACARVRACACVRVCVRVSSHLRLALLRACALAADRVISDGTKHIRSN